MQNYVQFHQTFCIINSSQILQTQFETKLSIIKSWIKEIQRNVHN